MLDIPSKDVWLGGLILIACCGYLAAARWAPRLTDGRPMVIYSIGFSLALTLLVLATGLFVLR